MHQVKPHQFLAMQRGEQAKSLSLAFLVSPAPWSSKTAIFYAKQSMAPLIRAVGSQDDTQLLLDNLVAAFLGASAVAAAPTPLRATAKKRRHLNWQLGVLSRISLRGILLKKHEQHLKKHNEELKKWRKWNAHKISPNYIKFVQESPGDFVWGLGAYQREIRAAMEDGLKRLMLPSLQREWRTQIGTWTCQ